jgi:hypothetical protein
MNTTPVRPEVKPETDDTEATVRERLATLEQDKKTAKPWPEVKGRILETARPR